MNLEDINLIETCGACPEQYDAYHNGEIVGYLRLRHGIFRVDYLANDERKVIYHGEPNGDGMFEPEEREFYLTEAKKAIIKTISGEDLVDEERENILKIEYVRGLLYGTKSRMQSGNFTLLELEQVLQQSADILGKVTGINREPFEEK
jgi:hypothetical protein